MVGGLASVVYRRWRQSPRPAAPAPPPPPSPAPPEGGTSPGTVPDHLEERRAAEAAQRERESRETNETKYETLRREQEAELDRQAAAIGDPPAPLDEENG
jgi:hypothetical protein